MIFIDDTQVNVVWSPNSSRRAHRILQNVVICLCCVGRVHGVISILAIAMPEEYEGDCVVQKPREMTNSNPFNEERQANNELTTEQIQERNRVFLHKYLTN